MSHCLCFQSTLLDMHRILDLSCLAPTIAVLANWASHCPFFYGMKLSDWPEWQATNNKQLKQNFDAATIGKVIPCSSKDPLKPPKSFDLWGTLDEFCEIHWCTQSCCVHGWPSHSSHRQPLLRGSVKDRPLITRQSWGNTKTTTSPSTKKALGPPTNSHLMFSSSLASSWTVNLQEERILCRLSL